jgi:hypothetical protein
MGAGGLPAFPIAFLSTILGTEDCPLTKALGGYGDTYLQFLRLL